MNQRDATQDPDNGCPSGQHFTISAYNVDRPRAHNVVRGRWHRGWAPWNRTIRERGARTVLIVEA